MHFFMPVYCAALMPVQTNHRPLAGATILHAATSSAAARNTSTLEISGASTSETNTSSHHPDLDSSLLLPEPSHHRCRLYRRLTTASRCLLQSLKAS